MHKDKKFQIKQQTSVQYWSACLFIVISNPGLPGSDLELPASLGVDPDGRFQVAEDRPQEGEATGLRQRLVVARQQEESRIQVLGNGWS